MFNSVDFKSKLNSKSRQPKQSWISFCPMLSIHQCKKKGKKNIRKDRYLYVHIFLLSLDCSDI